MTFRNKNKGIKKNKGSKKKYKKRALRRFTKKRNNHSRVKKRKMTRHRKKTTRKQRKTRRRNNNKKQKKRHQKGGDVDIDRKLPTIAPSSVGHEQGNITRDDISTLKLLNGVAPYDRDQAFDYIRALTSACGIAEGIDVKDKKGTKTCESLGGSPIPIKDSMFLYGHPSKNIIIVLNELINQTKEFMYRLTGEIENNEIKPGHGLAQNWRNPDFPFMISIVEVPTNILGKYTVSSGSKPLDLNNFITSPSQFKITISEIDSRRDSSLDGPQKRKKIDTLILKTIEALNITHPEGPIYEAPYVVDMEKVPTIKYDGTIADDWTTKQDATTESKWDITYEPSKVYMKNEKTPRYVPFKRIKDGEPKCVNGSLCTEPKLFSWIKTKFDAGEANVQNWIQFVDSETIRHDVLMDAMLRGYGCVWINSSVRSKDEKTSSMKWVETGDETTPIMSRMGIAGYKINQNALTEIGHNNEEKKKEFWDDIYTQKLFQVNKTSKLLGEEEFVESLQEKIAIITLKSEINEGTSIGESVLPSDDLLRAMAYPCPGCQMNYYDIKYGYPIAWNSDDCYIDTPGVSNAQNMYSGTKVFRSDSSSGGETSDDAFAREAIPSEVDGMYWMGARWVSKEEAETVSVEEEKEEEKGEVIGSVTQRSPGGAAADIPDTSPGYAIESKEGTP